MIWRRIASSASPPASATVSEGGWGAGVIDKASGLRGRVLLSNRQAEPFVQQGCRRTRVERTGSARLERQRGREPLVVERHGNAERAREPGRELAHLDGLRRVVTPERARQADQDPLGLELA